MIKDDKYTGKNSSSKMTLWLQGGEAGQFFPVTFFVFYSHLFLFGVQSKGRLEIEVFK